MNHNDMVNELKRVKDLMKEHASVIRAIIKALEDEDKQNGVK